jgi:maltooligosyltrehalose trehalohydrolase
MTARSGATLAAGGRCRFRVWAPRAAQVEVMLLAPDGRTHPLDPAGGGYHEAVVDGVEPGATYLYRLDGGARRPDPASRLQPEGVHGPSAVVAPPAPGWDVPGWRGLPLDRCVLYEVHVGTFTPEGTFDAIHGRLDDLRALGITFLQLMPVSAFPGRRNWGYDGVYPHAVHAPYGGPEGLRRLVAACHRRGLGVSMDLVFNHLGPEGNYLESYAPYQSTRYRTPWGPALNFDGPDSDEVRRYFIDSALGFIEDCGVDMLRLDAVHGIVDMSAYPFLAQLGREVEELAGRLGRQVHVIAESDLNDIRVLRPVEQGGFGLHGQWSDDFHHALHVLLTGERTGYYEDFDGLPSLKRSLEEGFVYSGQYSRHRRRRHGNDARDIAPGRLVVFSQNHDQVGNRMRGERMAALVSPARLRVAAAAVLLSPMVPLLFMGEEHGEPAPFQYFVSHSDPGLIEAVRAGRREEFASFGWGDDVPDPQDEETFLRSRVDWSLRSRPGHSELLDFHARLLALRREVPALAALTRQGMAVSCAPDGNALWWLREAAGSEALVALNFETRPMALPAPGGPGEWRLRLDSSAASWGGPGGSAPERLGPDERVILDPDAAVVYVRGIT